MRFHPDILGVRQRRVLGRLGPVLTSRGFYLAGGTALAAQLGHRRSVDLDWFTRERFPDPLRLAQDLRDEGIPFVTHQVDRGTLHGRVSGVRVTVLEYRYPLLQPLVFWEGFACSLASLPDLAAMKLSALSDRGAKKDFVDIYALGRRHASLRQMLAWYQQKFAVQDLGHLLYSLVYFDDANRERMPRLLWDTNWRDLKKTVRQWVREITS